MAPWPTGNVGPDLRRRIVRRKLWMVAVAGAVLLLNVLPGLAQASIVWGDAR